EAQHPAVGHGQDELAVLDALEQPQHETRGARSLRGLAGGRRGERDGVDSLQAHRVPRVTTADVVGDLPRNGTRLAQSRSACQWMRPIAPTVNSGYASSARATLGASTGAKRPLWLVSSSAPSRSS